MLKFLVKTGPMEKAMETQNILQKALDLSKQMLTLAEHQEWQKMEATMQERDTVLSQIDGAVDPQALSQESQEAVNHLFNQIKQIQSQVQQLAEQSHQQTMQALKASNANKKAVKSYQANR